MIELQLSQGKVALIDDEDAHVVAGRKWCAAWIRDRWYVMRQQPVNGRERTVYLHRLIMGNPPGKIVDHRNGDTFDCRKENLRVCTTSQNNQNSTIGRHNTSGYKGVSWVRKSRRWKAQIRVNKRCIHLGEFVDKIDASLSYDAAAREYFGDYARVNHAREGEQSAR